MKMTQHEPAPKVRVAPKYVLKTLGAPFKVTLLNSVSLSTDPSTGEEIVTIPDLVGLISEVVRTRVRHTRKLSGPEIKFIRNALGVRARLLAEFLEMTPEHLSRCEAGAKVMSGGCEKIFRMFAFIASEFKNPEDLLVKSSVEDAAKKEGANEPAVKKFVEAFLKIKIQPVFDSKADLHFTFVRKLCVEPTGGTDSDEPGREVWEEPKAA